MDHFIHQRVLKTYKASKAWRILMAVIVPPLVALSIFGAILPFFSDDPFFVANTALLTTIFGILAISSICGLITMFVFRIEVYANGMRQVELFRSKALLFTKYKSYRIITLAW